MVERGRPVWEITFGKRQIVLLTMFASSWVLLNVVSYSIYTDTQFQQIDIAECLRQDSTYLGMFSVVISQNVDKMSVATIVVARQESPNNWVFLVVELFLLVYHLDRAFST